MKEVPLLREYKLVDINSIKPHPSNPRKHTPQHISKIAEDIKKNGWDNPILIDKENNILAGHARYEAAKIIGLKEVPILKVDIGGTQSLAKLVWDNKISHESEWDECNLKTVLQQINDTDNSLLFFTGFDQQELKEILSKKEFYHRENLLSSIEQKEIIEKPLWAVLRYSEEDRIKVDTALSQLGIRVEKTYESK